MCVCVYMCLSQGAGISKQFRTWWRCEWDMDSSCAKAELWDKPSCVNDSLGMGSQKEPVQKIWQGEEEAKTGSGALLLEGLLWELSGLPCAHVGHGYDRTCCSLWLSGFCIRSQPGDGSEGDMFWFLVEHLIACMRIFKMFLSLPRSKLWGSRE